MSAPRRPAGLTTIAGVFLLASGYLLAVGVLMLIRPGAISMAAGAPLLGDFSLAGPYAFLWTGLAGGLIGAGLLRRNRLARWAAIGVSAIGIVLLLPAVSSAVLDFRIGKLVWNGLAIIARAAVIYCLSQPTAFYES